MNDVDCSAAFGMLDVQRICAAAYAVSVDGDDFRFVDSNEACLKLTGMSVSFHPGLTPHDIFRTDIADEIVRRYRTCSSTRQAVSYISEAASAEGPRAWRTTLFPFTDVTGHVASIIGICSTVTESAKDSTLSLNDKASLALGAIDGGYWIYEVTAETFETSRSLAELLAGPGRMTLSLAEYVSHVHVEDLGGALHQGMEDDRSDAEYRVVTFDGRTLWLKSRRRTLRDQDGRPTRMVGLVTDITQQKMTLDALQTEASTDVLTAIKNRRAFDRLAAEAFCECHRADKAVGLLLVDLDDFKPINDRLGHRVGDEVLRKVARRIARYVRKSECFARLGGDEFGILLRGSSAVSGEALAKKIRQAFTRPFAVEGTAVFVGISTGFGTSAPEDRTIADVFDRADRALYTMKQSRRLRSA